MTTSKNATVRVRLERMPPHMLQAPVGAPPCYGDPQKRTLNPACTSCAFNSRCAEYVDRACMDRSFGIGSRSPRRNRAVWSDDAPLVTGLRPPKRWRVISGALGGVWGDRSMPRIVSNLNHLGQTAPVVDAAAALGLLTIDAAVELALEAELFDLWLWHSPDPFVPDNYVTTVVWLTGAMAKRALLRQGRPNAFRSTLHREVLQEFEGGEWNAVSFGAEARRAEEFYRRFQEERLASLSLPPAA